MTTPAKYRKKPVVIEAMQWTGDADALTEFVGFQNWTRADAVDVPWTHADDGEQVVIYNNLEQCWVPCPLNHWVIQGVKREFYPCEDEVFAASYEAAE